MDLSQARIIKGKDLLDRIGEGGYGAFYRTHKHFGLPPR